LLVVGFTSDRVSCVPTECAAKPGSPSCARDWQYQTSRCEDQVLTYPDTNFHILLLIKSILFLSLIVLPIFYGNSICIDLFGSFSKLWKLRNDDPVTKDVEWRRRMHLQLELLKSSNILTRQYAIYHSIGAALDGFSLLTMLLHTLHFSEFDITGFPSFTSGDNILSKTTSYFSMTRSLCQNDTFFCEMPNRNLYMWFGIFSIVLLFIKFINRVFCLGFTLGLPGLFGRNMLLYADKIVDTNSEKVFQVQTNPVVVLAQAVSGAVHLIFIGPVQSLVSFIQFYIHHQIIGTTAKTEKAEEKIPKLLEILEPLEDKPTNGDASIPGDKKTRSVSTNIQNWSDLFFILDVMSDYIDTCEMLLFISKTEDLIAGIENKKVDIHASRLDWTHNTLTVRFTHCGVIETLMDLELSGTGGLCVHGWLEGPTGRLTPNVATNNSSKSLTFNISQGATYELISALFARGRQLSRMQNFSFHVPQEIKARYKKKYGTIVPLSVLVQPDSRPLSINFDIGR